MQNPNSIHKLNYDYFISNNFKLVADSYHFQLVPALQTCSYALFIVLTKVIYA